MRLKNTYTENLIATVIDYSESNNWESAVTEWEIYDCEEDESNSETCICGKENIRYLYTIRNILNGNELFPSSLGNSLKMQQKNRPYKRIQQVGEKNVHFKIVQGNFPEKRA